MLLFKVSLKFFISCVFFISCSGVLKASEDSSSSYTEESRKKRKISQLIASATLADRVAMAQGQSDLQAASLEVDIQGLSTLEGCPLHEVTKILFLRNADSLTSLKGIEDWHSLECLYISDALRLSSLGVRILPRSLLSLTLTGARSLKTLSGIESASSLLLLDLQGSSLESFEDVSFSHELCLNITNTPLAYRHGIVGSRPWKDLKVSFFSDPYVFSSSESGENRSEWSLTQSLQASLEKTKNGTLELDAKGLRSLELEGFSFPENLKTLILKKAEDLLSLKGLETWEGLEHLYIWNASKLVNIEGSALPRSLISLSIAGASSLKRLASVSWEHLRDFRLEDSALEMMEGVVFSDDLILYLQNTPLVDSCNIRGRRKWKYFKSYILSSSLEKIDSWVEWSLAQRLQASLETTKNGTLNLDAKGLRSLELEGFSFPENLKTLILKKAEDLLSLKGLETWEGLEHLYIWNASKLVNIEGSALPRSLISLSIAGASSLKRLASVSWEHLRDFRLEDSALEMMEGVVFSDDLVLHFQNTPLGDSFNVRGRRKWKYFKRYILSSSLEKKSTS